MRSAELVRAAEFAVKTLLRFQVDRFPVDPMAMLKQIPNVRVMTYSEAIQLLPDAQCQYLFQRGPADAMTFPGMDEHGRFCYLVVYRDQQMQAKVRFALAHELGHIALSHASRLFEMDRTSAFVSVHYSTAQEEAADCYACHLLMPRVALQMLAAREECLYQEQLTVFFRLSPGDVRRALDRYQISDISADLQQKLQEQLAGWLSQTKLPKVSGAALHPIHFI